MLCPSCNNQLKEIKANDFVFHICNDSCGGILFKKPSLKKILTRIKDTNQKLPDIKVNCSKTFPTSQIRKCPDCNNRKMAKHLMNGTEIDECYKCGDIWLDRGEFEKIYFKSLSKRNGGQKFDALAINVAIDINKSLFGYNSSENINRKLNALKAFKNPAFLDELNLIFRELKNTHNHIKTDLVRDSLINKTMIKNDSITANKLFYNQPSTLIKNQINKRNFITRIAYPLIPRYNEITLFLISLTCILIYITQPQFCISIIILGPGIVIAMYHVFSSREKNEWERSLMLYLACFTNVVSGFAAGIYIFVNSANPIFIILAVCNILNCFLLPFKYVVSFGDGSSFDNDDATFTEIIFGSIVIIITFLICHFIFEIFWAFTFSTCITYACNVNRVVNQFLFSRPLKKSQ